MFGTAELESIWSHQRKRVLSVTKILRVKPSRVERRVEGTKGDSDGTEDECN